MEISAFCFCLLMLVVSTQGRIAVTDAVLPYISNELDKGIATTDPVAPTPGPITNVSHEMPTTHHEELPKEGHTANSTEDLNLTTVRPLTKKEQCSNNITTDVFDNLIPSDNDPCGPNTKDHDEVLILTTYIEKGRSDEGRKASEVNPDLFLGIKSYSGFFTVNKTYDSNIFFWYFPVEKKLVQETPWIIWLQGGPGASSMTGLFDEIGPFKFDKRKMLVRNPYSWLQNHSLVFLDNPVGTGFSFTKHENGYVTDMATYTNHLYSTLTQFLQIFPELRTAPLFVAGESYAGKYVPALGMEIHKHKGSPGGNINLKGLIIGNAYVEPEMIAQVTRPFYHFGMLVREQLDIVQPLVDAFRADIAANRSVQAKEKWNSLVAILLFLSHQKQAYNFLSDELAVGKYDVFLKKAVVKRALHVGAIEHSFVNITVNTKLAPDFLSNTRPLFEALLNEYRVLAYCGQLDQMLPCAVSSEHYRKWKWDKSEEFLNATRYPLIFNNHLAGYHKTGGGLTEVLVRGAGHMAPLDAPATTHELVTRWAAGTALSKPVAPNLDDMINFVREKVEAGQLPAML